jgi:nicotinate phosphoribosyltransferase
VPRSVETAIEVAQRYRDRLGHTLAAVRLDSGDLLEQSRHVRAELERTGLTDVQILASGDLDEFKIQALLAAGAPVDGFGVGTSVGVGAGSVEQDVEGGALGGVYKAVLYVDERGHARPMVKVAGDKSTFPGKKEVYRIGRFDCDVVQLADEPKPRRGERLLKPVIVAGDLAPGALPPLSEIRELAETNLAQLPDPYHQLQPERPYPVRFSQALCALRERAVAELQPEGAPTEHLRDAAPAAEGTPQ